jgi:hypothetical protein
MCRAVVDFRPGVDECNLSGLPSGAVCWAGRSRRGHVSEVTFDCPSIEGVTVRQKPGRRHPLAHKLFVVPVAAVSGGLEHGWRGLVTIDADWTARRNMAPFPLFRWAVGIGILVWTAVGSAPHSVSGWFTAYFPWLLVVGIMTLAPEVVRIEFGGLKMELLRETREEVKALADQLVQLQIQQAAATSNATATITQNFTEAAAVAGVTSDVKQGEETKAVPAEEIDWNAFLRRPRYGEADPPGGKPPSADTGRGSTVEE